MAHLSKIAMLCRICYTKDAALLHSGNRREVSLMVQILTDIIVAVAAQVIADCLCKWLAEYRGLRFYEPMAIILTDILPTSSICNLMQKSRCYEKI